MNLREDIAGWDGKSAEAIGRIYTRHRTDLAFVRNILDYSKVGSLEVGATWLLKRYVEEGGEPDAGAVYGLVPGLGHWEAKLHVLQCMPRLQVPASQRKTVERFLRDCMADEAKFVRAWAYSGFHAHAAQYPAYRDEARRLLEAALQSEPASVKARIRKALKQAL